ncbi:M14 family metallopeptidase [Agromyces cerinus]|uniref:Zinc carboxypeptidase n=1 Tax=Agromyces cerinus subsp. cerinus TaxID=232089 RepID=A0A1N6F3S6_9MICO|nr:M14 family metallopeptidase [Agromyces cerinus]SIN89899.1 Immune inhibitor A peptidase M6 [Agromyces cerinus subsp. cerinus]
MAGTHRIPNRLVFGVAALGLMMAMLSPLGASAVDNDAGALDMYTADVSAADAAEIAAGGFDVADSRVTDAGVSLDMVLTADEAKGLQARGLDVKVKKNKNGKSAKQLATEQAANGYNVWRSWDEQGGIRDELYRLAKQNPQLVKLEVLGHTYQGREIIALKLTQGARGQADGTRPAVLYSSTQHAREWISTEVNRRLLNSFIDGWRANDKATRDLLRNNELWFVLVANPDGYQYTFDHERLWRKNLRDNDGDNEITRADGVDPNRNYPEHWGYDEEGSSSQISSDTYRGPSAGSEPETQAMMSLLDRGRFEFQVNYHSFGQWLLYAEGWQTGTPTADDPIYYALSGNRDNPAIPDFEPGLSSDVLYVTNGETTDFAHSQNGTLAWTPELGEGDDDGGFVFPDDEAQVQAEFERALPFALDVAKSAADPANPVSHLGLETKPFYLESDDTYKDGLPQVNYTFDYSYGDPQEVRVIAKRSLGDVTLMYSINGDPAIGVPTEEWTGGDRYGGKTGVYFHTMSGLVTGTTPGDDVEVWFEGGGETSESFTYRAVEESTDDVLIMAAEDYTGASPAQAGGPNYLGYYQDALDANGTGYDVYDVDARARTAPDALGVLSHYDAVIWYTGEDIITREPGWGGGNASRLALDNTLEVRDFLNEGGRVLYTGKYAGTQYTGTDQLYDPTAANAQCRADAAVQERCRPLGGSGDFTNDMMQYWLGAYLTVDDAGTAEDGGLLDVLGVDTPFTGLDWGFNGAESADNQDHSNSFITTSGILDPAVYPQFDSWVAGRWDREGGPFEPHTGDAYAYSQIGDVSYKRLTNTIDVPAGGATMSFWTSYDTEANWDHIAVEARPAGGEDWTTLPDLNGNTTQSTGDSCPAGWRDLHPQLDHYQTLDAETTTCTPTGTTGEWWADSGNSAGWQQWSVDLSAYAGGPVELSIAYVSDWSSQGLGVFVDDIEVSTGEGTTSFENGDTGGWTIAGPPPGSAPNPNNFIITTAAGFPEAAVVATPGSLTAGFGFEGITDAAARAAWMSRALDHLLD